MAAPIWITTKTNLGTVQHGVRFSRQVIASGTVNYTLQSGSLPAGVVLSTATGQISGVPFEQNYNSNNPVSTFTFVVRATNQDGDYADQTFKICLLSQELLLPKVFNQYHVRYITNFFQYQIPRGVVNGATNMYWRLDHGEMPPGGELYQNGSIEVMHSDRIAPFSASTFMKPTIAVLPEHVVDSFNEFARLKLSIPSDNDHQFVVALRSPTGPIQFSITVRITYLTITGLESWFTENSNYVVANTALTYVFMTTSDSDFITWDSAENLPDLANGAISDLDVRAKSNTGKQLTYALKPIDYGQLPLGLVFYTDGILAGRVGFRCHVDDPVNLPVNDDYEFIIRAKTLDTFTFTEKRFRLHINKVHNEPYVNVWVRSFPVVETRQKLETLLGNRVLFPDRLLYRKNDPWFGKPNELRFLFAPGLRVKTIDEYYQALEKNHYDKTLLLGEVKTAVAYDQNLRVQYEVVYLPIIDNLSKVTKSGETVSLSDSIDLRSQIKNFYWVNGNPTYIFTPNGLENMRNQLEQTIGYYNQGILPLWMTSPQPIMGKPGQYTPPIGFQQAIVLCYTIPKGSENIAYRLRRAKINFNDFRFEFDRYELDDNLTKTFDTSLTNFTGSTETVFDDGATKFEDSATRFNKVSDFVGGQGPGAGNKYLKFPKTGAFK
jgi:hypothetical protein